MSLIDVPEPPSVELGELSNIGELKRRAVNYKWFGQYDKGVTAALSNAREYVEGYVQLVAGAQTDPQEDAIVILFQFCQFLGVDQGIEVKFDSQLGEHFNFSQALDQGQGSERELSE